jgi:hypothetical protein
MVGPIANMFPPLKNSLIKTIIRWNSIARVQRPAPFFSAPAVLPNKEFKDVSLTDFKNKWLGRFVF